MHEENLIEVRNLKKYFPIKKGLLGRKTEQLKAVDDLSFTIKKGETFGLVGESGCGKSTTGRSIIRLHDVTSGNVLFDGTDIASLKESELKEYRKRMQIIFQDPYASLNPSMNVFQIISEPMNIHGSYEKEEQKEIILDLLKKVGLKEEHLYRYPHEFSGGQRQRISIARALSVKPDFILCDEPISALDVSVQAQVVNMLQDIQEETGVTYLFIAHDLSMVRHISDRIGVMYLGNIVEIADSEDLYTKPAHPYTQALLSSMPEPDPTNIGKERIILQGEVPSPLNSPSGCKFRTRCKFATEKCAQEVPKMVEIAKGHQVACHLF
ncbi:TPA: ABC transporter ATP-binding protein [Bacillus cereus]|uniref:ABC transporter ATP-binding protein n=1 Tax=Bacillus cereus group TaxID=86661 RepID=UPI00024122C9|nr:MULTISPECIES: ABC transporter ATP-binding protein [Bacillus cereus group]EHL71439.1 oligopeptide/dipeptide ABC transporter, ATP-binding protein domain [Bacillus sp. 7_6_55CFAA_CT2]MCU4731596.1 ABC transporter ATP-binding protein [Bacillus cereus]TKJ07598.1 ABC transporter ATP-binding protein [Bacillus cereus]HDR4912374.1 ABC transporter ATP-binding protein [Bacillus cereus]HDR4915903.1 ABC transporter ATP-binding protein [Bacillus cereus]